MISLLLIIFQIKVTTSIMSSSPERYFGFFDVVRIECLKILFCDLIKDDMMHYRDERQVDPWVGCSFPDMIVESLSTYWVG